MRQGELARAFAKHEIRKSGIRVNGEKMRDLGNEVTNLNAMGLVPPGTIDELTEFYVILANEVFEDFKKRVSTELAHKKSRC